MQHTLNTDVVEATGSFAAGILFNAIDFYIDKVWGDETRFHDGDYWTYASNKSLQKSFPYMSSDQVRRAMGKLVDSGLLKTGNFNKMVYDRTLWYTFGEKGTRFRITAEDIRQICQRPVAKMPNQYLL